MTSTAGPARLFLAAAALSLGVVAAALVTQHVLGMLPCPWCVLQRLIFVVIATLALMGAALSAVTRAPIARRVAAGLMLANLIRPRLLGVF
jgi:disulfide bond formation protein DsbB